MKRITQVFKDLMTPDDQSGDWYSWATNQLSHAFLGAVVSVMVGAWGLAVVLFIAVAKEVFDIIKGAKWLDSIFDIAFWFLGAISASSNMTLSISGIVCLIILLYVGIYKRIIR